jgi:hypothetical protein
VFLKTAQSQLDMEGLREGAMAAVCEHYENHPARYYAWISGGVALKIKENQNRETHLVLKQKQRYFLQTHP